MTKEELLRKFRHVLDESPQALLATVTEEGYPAMRYMSPAMVKGNDGALYAVTAASFPKVKDLAVRPLVSWMLTNPKTREIFSFRGKIRLVEDPRFKSELLEQIGRGLETFWRLNDDPSDLVCLETVLVSGEYFNPKTAEKAQVEL
jgi:pyridoxamine 5'-phosphate oxidase